MTPRNLFVTMETGQLEKEHSRSVDGSVRSEHFQSDQLVAASGVNIFGQINWWQRQE
jgi:hypothetical protein